MIRCHATQLLEFVFDGICNPSCIEMDPGFPDIEDNLDYIPTLPKKVGGMCLVMIPPHNHLLRMFCDLDSLHVLSIKGNPFVVAPVIKLVDSKGRLV